MRAMTALVLVLASAVAAEAKLKVGELVPCYGPLGPVRKENTYVPGDEIAIRMHVSGVKVDAEGNNRIQLFSSLTGPKGEEIQPAAETISNVLVPLGGGEFTVAFVNPILLGLAAGDYMLTVKVEDRESGESSRAVFAYAVVKPRFTVGAVRFSYDEAGNVHAPAGGYVSQVLFARCQGVGYDRTQGLVDVLMELRLYDDAGKETLVRPLRRETRSKEDIALNPAAVTKFEGGFSLNRPGTFRLKITLTDNVSKAADTFECPLTVLPLPK